MTNVPATKFQVSPSLKPSASRKIVTWSQGSPPTTGLLVTEVCSGPCPWRLLTLGNQQVPLTKEWVPLCTGCIPGHCVRAPPGVQRQPCPSCASQGPSSCAGERTEPQSEGPPLAPRSRPLRPESSRSFRKALRELLPWGSWASSPSALQPTPGPHGPSAAFTSPQAHQRMRELSSFPFLICLVFMEHLSLKIPFQDLLLFKPLS